MSDWRLIFFCLFMAFVWSPVMIIVKIYDVLAYPFIRYNRMKKRQKWEQKYRNKLLFGDDKNEI